MNPITHLLIGWGLANTADLNRRERGVVTLAAVVPDIDGLGIIADFATRNSSQPSELWGSLHHVLGHNLGVGILVSAVAFAVATRRWLCATLAFIAFNLHIVGDVIGGRGPDGDQWPIPYLLPFSDRWQLAWSGQWELNNWPNIALTVALLSLTFYLGWGRGYSPLELVSRRADTAFIAALRARFGSPTPGKRNRRSADGCSRRRGFSA